MKIIIVENEIYLAQSIQNNLTEKIKANCEIYGSYSEVMEKDADVFLINTNLQGNLKNLITEKKDKIIILLVPYVTYSNVTHPIELGADDYLQKPFTIEELIRKILHLRKYYKLQEEAKSLKNFIEFIFKNIELKIPKYHFPIFIKSRPNKVIEKFAYEISKRENLPLEILDLQKKLKKKLSKSYIYLCLNYDKCEDKSSIEKILKYNSIILLPKDYNINHKCIELEATTNNFFDDEILTIEEYIKYVIQTHQHKFPDTELSKKLGISRKSLWEKRKKYGIFKQK